MARILAVRDVILTPSSSWLFRPPTNGNNVNLVAIISPDLLVGQPDTETSFCILPTVFAHFEELETRVNARAPFSR